MIVIHEQPVEFVENKTDAKATKLASCCGCLCTCTGMTCICDTGYTNMTVNFEKNVYFANDMANSMVNIDNSQSHLDIKEVDF